MFVLLNLASLSRQISKLCYFKDSSAAVLVSGNSNCNSTWQRWQHLVNFVVAGGKGSSLQWTSHHLEKQNCYLVGANGDIPQEAGAESGSHCCLLSVAVLRRYRSSAQQRQWYLVAVVIPRENSHGAWWERKKPAEVVSVPTGR